MGLQKSAFFISAITHMQYVCLRGGSAVRINKHSQGQKLQNLEIAAVASCNNGYK